MQISQIDYRTLQIDEGGVIPVGEAVSLLHRSFPYFSGLYFYQSQQEALKAATDLAQTANGRGKTIQLGGKDGELAYNDSDALASAMKKEKIATVIIPPLFTKGYLILPQRYYLKKARQLCDEQGAALIFDESNSAFLAAAGFMQEVLGVQPDLTCFFLGVGVLAQNRKCESDISCGETVCADLRISQGWLDELTADGLFKILESRTAILAGGLKAKAKEIGLQLEVVRIGRLFSFYFPGNNGQSAAFAKLLAGYGINMAADGVNYISSCHSPEVIEKTIEAAGDALKLL